MFLKSIKINGLLSFKDVQLEMRPLNVLIGPNASGKSNLIEVIAMLQAVPRDLSGFFRRSGGIHDWLWKGDESGINGNAAGEVEVIINQARVGQMPLRYVLSVSEQRLQLDIREERLEYEEPRPGYSDPFFLFQVRNGRGQLAVKWQDEGESQRQTQTISPEDLTPGHSVLQDRKDPSLYEEMNYVGRQFDAFRLYREWNLGRNSEIRRPQPTDSPTNFLEENFANLVLVLNQLEGGAAMPAIEDQLKRFYETYERIGVNIQANTAQLWIRERGLGSAVPATRLSDGTLRFLALLTILCHPEPPSLICIEEPELGLHPDIIPQLAKLLKSASERTQLIVTTHSKHLIDELHDDPESVVICERYPDVGTELKRLDKNDLTEWLDKYELGELWETGHIGGTRW